MSVLSVVFKPGHKRRWVNAHLGRGSEHPSVVIRPCSKGYKALQSHPVMSPGHEIIGEYPTLHAAKLAAHAHMRMVYGKSRVSSYGGMEPWRRTTNK